jgi:hypothetical protein
MLVAFAFSKLHLRTNVDYLKYLPPLLLSFSSQQEHHNNHQ